MNEIYNHNNSASPLMDQERFFKIAALPFEKSKEEIWDILDQRISQGPPSRVVNFRVRRIAWAAAAVLLILAGTMLVMRYYSRSVVTAPAHQLAYNLPDGSSVKMNAGTSLTYYPLWWKVERIVSLDGEGFFEVVKGKKFSVKSEQGTTEVLGTSFNIFARQDEYMVTCFTGAVKVVSPTWQEVVLNPDYQATIDSQGNIIVSKESQPEKVNSWIHGMFSFTSKPLISVLQEIERQYDVSITLQAGSEYLYTGYFSKDKSVEEVLQLVCKPFGLNFAKSSERSFEIY